MKTRDVVIAGGGIIGCSIAFKLAEAGLKVSLIERNSLGCEASRAGAGMLSPQSDSVERTPFFELCMKSRLLYPDFASRLAEISGIDPEYQAQGTLCVAVDDCQLQEINRWSSWQMAAGLRVQQIDSAQAHKIEPGLTETALGGVFLPDEHQVESRRLMDALGSAVRHLGVEVIEGTAVERLIIEKGACLGVRDHAGKTHYAGAVITAAGSWSGELLDTAGLKLPVVPARGQMLALRGPVLPFEHVVHADQCYLVPRRDKRIIVGSTVEYTGFRKEVTARGISTLLSKAISTFPHLAEFEIVETWSGLRPDTSDHLPVLGPSGIDNLFLATGHFRNGILLAPITAEIIRDGIIEERWPTETTSHFGFGRFAALSEAATGDGS